MSAEALVKFAEWAELQPDQQAAFLETLARESPTVHAIVLRFIAADARATEAGFMASPIDPARPATPAELTHQPGEVVGPYTLTRLLGRGGMGDVWLAERSDGRAAMQVAIKFVNLALQRDLLRARFARERQILASLSHPNIAQMFDTGETSANEPYLVLEYVDGAPITQVVQRQALDLRARLKLLLQVMAAVAHAHGALVIHRDIKPGNVLVNANGQVKLLDFGVAKLVAATDVGAESTALTRALGRALTPEYAAPEQFGDVPLTIAVDVYALGVLMFELLTGSRPFTTRPTGVTLIEAVRTREPERPSRAVSDARTARLLRGDLDTIVAKALKRESHARYATVQAFAADVEAYLDKRPIAARPDSWIYTASRFAARNPGATLAAGVATLAIVTGVVAVADQAEKARQGERRAKASADFLAGMFKAATPEATGGRDITARELLLSAEAQLDRAYIDQPDVRYQLLGNLADAQRLVNNREAQLKLALKQRDLAEKLYGQASFQYARALVDVVAGYQGLQKWPETISAGDTALPVARAHPGRPGQELLEECLRGVGEAHARVKNWPQSEAILTEALTIASQLEPQGGIRTASARHQLAFMYGAKGDWVKQVELMRAVIGFHRAEVNPDVGAVSSAYRELANAQFGGADWQAVVETTREGIERLSARVGASSPVVRTLSRTQGLALMNLQREAEAAEVFRKIVANMPPLAERDHTQRVDLMSAHVELANLALRAGDFAAARSEAQQALAEPMLPGREPPFLHIWGAVRSLIQLDVIDGHAASALQRANDLVVRGSKEYGESHPYMGTFYALLGVSELAAGKGSAAVAAHQKAQGIFEAKLKANHPRRLQTLLELSVAHAAAGDMAAARARLDEARSQFGPTTLSMRDKGRMAWVAAQLDRAHAKDVATRAAAEAAMKAAAVAALGQHTDAQRTAWTLGMVVRPAR